MLLRFLHVLLIASVLFSCTTPDNKPKEYLQYVDPLIGSGYHGHVFVGANVPFGAVQLGPNNPTQGWDWCSGYHYTDSVLIGFAHTHLSGTGIGDLGDLVFMPVSSDFKSAGESQKPYPWQSTYSHDNETAEAGYYALHIDRYNIDAALTATKRAGFHKYTYNNEGNAFLVIDLKYGTGWDKITKGNIEQVDDYSIKGLRFSSGWARDQRLFYYTQFSKPIKHFEIIANDDNLGQITALIEFEGNGELLAKTGISPVCTEGAQNNLMEEIDGWDFNRVKNAAQERWNKELAKIKITTDSEAEKKIFYTALYHTMIAPSLFNDSNGDYRGADNNVHKNPGHETYTTLSLWDTYRAAHPLYTLIQPEMVNDFVRTFIDIYDQQGKLPIWHLHGNETNTMVGYHAVPVIADAYLKGFRDFNAVKAFEAMKTSAMRDEKGLNFVKSQGYIPSDSQVESVARALEYAIDDWCIAAMANALGKKDDATLFSKRAQYYHYYFDKDSRFMRGKKSDGNWRTPFDPVSSQHRDDDYCEGNSWQYTWLVPQDVEGLIDLFGSEEAFSQKLDSLFTINSEQVEGASSDISGLIGQYAHGNEPSHHTTYLYAFAGQQWKTAKLVDEICRTMYTDKNDGLCGNEDCGQMSAWYVLSSMGFYPVNPAAGAYVLGRPMFNESEIALPEGKSFKIIAEDNSRENKYIQSASLNGKTYEKTFITHKDIMNGGELKLKMGSEPNREFGAAPENRPQSIVY
ncbi:MAG: sugar hydrolase [Draconibacterium sp.]|nr:MAG: sugar hydrolase [Draconibacterium sp.]PIF05153.1 MAG: sugar hydrolase [Draconibacterium sp.]